MFTRKILLMALSMGLLASSPASLLAEDGPGNSSQATARAADVGAASKARSEKAADKALPPGIENNFPGGTLPPGIARTRTPSEPSSDDPVDPLDPEETEVVEDTSDETTQDCSLSTGGMLNLGCG